MDQGQISQTTPSNLPTQEITTRFKQIAEYIEEVFWMTDPTKNAMLYISPGYEKIWGRTVQSLIDNPRNWIEAIIEEDRKRILDAAMTKQVNGTYDEEYRITRADGSIRWIHDKAYPIKNDQGVVYRVVGVASDITDKKGSSEDLRQKTSELENLNKLFVNRELKMAELKKENEELKKQLSTLQPGK